MKIIKIENISLTLMEQLVRIWRNSVKATHLFLSDAEIENIQKYIPQALLDIPHLIVAEQNDGIPVAFMGIDKQKLEMLFVLSKKCGQGIGRKLIEYGIKEYSINELGVNEQNPKAKEFYMHMGFQVYKRTETDEQGMPYPILYMKLS